MEDALLRKYFEFDEADLLANRSGVLTGRQRTRLIENARFTRNIFLVAGSVVLCIGVLPSLILWLVKAEWMFWVIWSIVWIPLWSFFGVKVIRMGKPQRNLTVKKAEGKVNIVREESYNTAMKQTEDDYELHIDGKTFDVDSELANVIVQGDHYAIYYVEGTNDVLSAERISDRI
jgi:membrane protein implicated in regulation of membrane protease activity